MIENKRNIVLFDGVCNLCNCLVQFIIKRDPKATFSFAAIQSEMGQELLMQMKSHSDELNSVVYIRDENYFFKSSAILHIFKDMGGIWKLFYVFIIIPSFIRDSVYAVIARTRYKVFGKRETCMIPSADIQNRFLE
jgi:predicted DCC family thiol-disulfide oxidoreductase YuxK